MIYFSRELIKDSIQESSVALVSSGVRNRSTDIENGILSN